MTRDELIDELKRCPTNSEVFILAKTSKVDIAFVRTVVRDTELKIGRIDSVPKILIEAVE